jgi:hypothetical protein
VAIGDDATAAGYPLVPESGEEGRVRWGSRELNRTRDFIAQLKTLLPNNKPAYRSASGIASGTGSPSPSLGNDGDIYFRIID